MIKEFIDRNLAWFKLAGIIAIVLGAFWVHHSIRADGIEEGKRITQALWDADKLAREKETKRQIIAAVAKNEADRQDDLKLARKATEDYEKQLNQQNTVIDNQRATIGQLRVTANRSDVCGNSEGSQTAGSVKPDDSRTVTFELPETYRTGLLDVGKDADTKIAACIVKLNVLQDWVTAKGFYGGEP